jgi:hypothetical protein
MLPNIKKALDDKESPTYVEGLRQTLRDAITLNEELASLLAAPELRVVRDRLMELSEQPTDGNGANKVVSQPTSITLHY